MRIAIVNDLKLAVDAMQQALAETEHQIAWIAKDGKEAVIQCAKDTPDLILMDLFMPIMDGVEATRIIMQKSPCAILIVTANVDQSVSKVFEAMGAGALDAVNTPVFNLNWQAQPLIKKIEMLNLLIENKTINGIHKKQQRSKTGSLIVIGASTGGPAILSSLLQALPSDFPAAIVIVQHVDIQFSKGLAEWLSQTSKIKVEIAKEGDHPSPGTVLLAGSNDHLILTSKRTLTYTKEPITYHYRPSINVFFESVAQYWPEPSLAILLTGMGKDGAMGLLQLRQAGWHTIAQDKESCTVYGMPKAAFEMNAAVQILNPTQIAEAILQCAMA